MQTAIGIASLLTVLVAPMTSGFIYLGYKFGSIEESISHIESDIDQINESISELGEQVAFNRENLTTLAKQSPSQSSPASQSITPGTAPVGTDINCLP